MSLVSGVGFGASGSSGGGAASGQAFYGQGEGEAS